MFNRKIRENTVHRTNNSTLTDTHKLLQIWMEIGQRALGDPVVVFKTWSYANILL